jgi:hypothetical protein
LDEAMAEDKKIIIDEDWKSQVQAEKEQAAKQKAAPQAQGQRPSDLGDVVMPPASLELLLTSLATEALVALGQVPHPATQQVHVHREHAKYLIDTVEVLREKTKGNLTPGEQNMIDNLLHQLRLVFVETGKDSAQSASAGNPA